MADRNRDRHFDREQRWQGSGYWVDDEEFVEERRERHPGDRTRAYEAQDARRYRQEALDQQYRWQDPRFRRPERGDWDTRYSEGRDAGQERAWDYASRTRQERDEYGPAEPGNWHRRGGQAQGSGWHDWPERQEPNRRQDVDWNERQRGDWQDRPRDDWNNRQGDDWQERSRRERWFARDNSERDWVEDTDFYANRGWARPSSAERERDWGFRNRQYPGEHPSGRARRFEIDFNREHNQPHWRSERDFGRGVDAEQALSARRSQAWDADRQRPSDEAEQMSRERPYSGRETMRGPHRGAGPKGYQRSDERIKEEVCERLTWHGQIDASNIEIDVKDGEVTLRGQVEHKYEKRMAEDVIEAINGVKDIQNQIRVQK